MADNGRRTKFLEPGVDFPIKKNGDIDPILMLRVDPKKPDILYVRILRRGCVNITVGEKDPEAVTDDTGIEKEGLYIHDPKTNHAIKIIYIRESDVVRLSK